MSLIDFDCPFGFTRENYPKPVRGLGDIVAGIATPIARALNLGCVDQSTNDLKPESRCAKWKRGLNKIGKKSVAAPIETE